MVVSNYFFEGTNIGDYNAVLGGASLILTAIIHPEGIAPFFQGLLQYFGRWLLRARGREWLAVAKRLGPIAILGFVAGYLIWPARVDTYSKFWMPLLGAFLALFIRSIIVTIIRSRRGELRHPISTGPADRTVPVAEAV